MKLIEKKPCVERLQLHRRSTMESISKDLLRESFRRYKRPASAGGASQAGSVASRASSRGGSVASAASSTARSG